MILFFQKSLDYSDLDGMGTTLVAAAIVGKEIVFANIDSRLMSTEIINSAKLQKTIFGE